MARRLNGSKKLVLIAHNIRSTHNVGSLFRTCDGLGVNKLVLTGYTAYPKTEADSRLEYLANKLDRQIDKTALGAQKHLSWDHDESLPDVIQKLRKQDYKIYALEQYSSSTSLLNSQTPDNIALIVGNELTGLEPEALAYCDKVIEIPMLGIKESFNVVQAAAMALFYFRYS